MIINLFSYNTESSTPETFFSFNQIVSWSLHEALIKKGVETRFIGNGQFIKEDTPKADHSIIISSFTMQKIRDVPALRQKMRDATRGKMTLYLDSDYMGWCNVFDYVFTVVKPVRPEPQYVYAGWGANPNIFYTEQDERAAFLDCFMYGKYKGRFNDIYDDIKDVFHLSEEQQKQKKPIIHKTTVDGTKITLYLPVPTYRGNKLLWPEFSRIQRKCHFYLCTQLGESGLSRIESATCGALLVVPEKLYRPRTMASLEHRIWRTQDELIDILKMKTNPATIREKALEHSWDKVADRILNALEDKPD